jgi:hypothetical protein
MIQLELTICRIDNKTIDRSPAYKLIKLCCGERVADGLTYTVTIPKDV